LNRIGLTLLLALMAFVIYNDMVEVGWWKKLLGLLSHFKR
jgi:hypothetical protein